MIDLYLSSILALVYASQNNRLESRLVAAKAKLDPSTSCSEDYWTNFRINLRADYATKNLLENEYIPVLKQLNKVCRQIIDFAAKGYLYGDRISSEFSNQPKPVDSVVDDFAVEAQNFANSLTMAAAFGAGALALRLFDQNIAEIFSAILGALNILIAFGTMTSKFHSAASLDQFLLIMTNQIHFKMLHDTRFETKKLVYHSRTKNSRR